MGRNLALHAIALLCAGCASAPLAVAPSPVQEPVAAAPSASADAATFSGDFDSLVDRTDHKLELSEGQPLDIDNPHGDVRLRFGGYQHVLEVHGVAQRPDRSRAAFVTAPVATDAGVQLQPRLADGSAPLAGERVDLTVFVPLGHAVRVRTAAGLIESRGSKSDLQLESDGGDISVRGNAGRLEARTTTGQIEVAFEDAVAGSRQRLETSTGTIIAAFADSNNLALAVETSAPIATEYSLSIERLIGAEPNKRARLEVGQPAAELEIHSKRGEVRLLRRAAFTPAVAASPAP